MISRRPLLLFSTVIACCKAAPSGQSSHKASWYSTSEQEREYDNGIYSDPNQLYPDPYDPLCPHSSEQNRFHDGHTNDASASGIDDLLFTLQSHQGAPNEPLFTMSDILQWDDEEQGLYDEIDDQTTSYSPLHSMPNEYSSSFTESSNRRHEAKYNNSFSSDPKSAEEEAALVHREPSGPFHRENSYFAQNLHGHEEGTQFSSLKELSRKGKQKHHLPAWKRSLRGNILKAYQTYQRINTYTKKTAMIHIDAVADKELTWQLLDKDPEKQLEAATEIKERASRLIKLNKMPKLRTRLGEVYEETLEAFMIATGRSRERSQKLLTDALTPDLITLLQDPETFDEAIQTLAETLCGGTIEENEGFDPNIHILESSSLAPVEVRKSDSHYNKPVASAITYLGQDYQKLIDIFMRATKRSYSTATRHIQATVTADLAEMIKNPETKREGIEMVLKAYKGRLGPK